MHFGVFLVWNSRKLMFELDCNSNSN